jgi:hypothetical protein
MASFNLARSDLFPVGTSVAAYPAAALRKSEDSVPSGAATESQVVGATGVAAFVALAADTDYVFFAVVGGQKRMTKGRTKTATGAQSVRGALGQATGVATTSSGSASLTAVSASTGAFAVGQLISGPGIPAGARLISGSGASWTMDTKATASGVGVAVVADAGNTWAARVKARRVAVGTS